MSANSAICALCLETVETTENIEVNASDTVQQSVQSFKQFVNFSRAYLKVKTGVYFEGNCGRTLPRLCEECADEVKVAVEVHTQVERLKCQLLWKVMKLGEILKRSQKKVQNCYFETIPIHSASSSVLLQVFRRQVERKCMLKARKILPSVMLRKNEDIIAEVHETEEWRLVNRPSPMEIQFLVALIVLFSSVYGWDLSKIIKAFPCDNSKAWFVRVTANSTETTIPTRQTLRAFIIFMLVLSLGNDWNLEKILQQRSQKIEQLVFKTMKRKPGRPPGSGVKKLRMETLESLLLPKRKPGRPPNSWNLSKNSTSAKNVQHVFKTLQRKPGRPPGSGVKKSCPSIGSTQVPKRKPGRPPKSCNVSSKSSAPENIQIQVNKRAGSLGNRSTGFFVKRRKVRRPPKKRRGRLPNSNLENVKFEIPEPQNENVDSPRKITLHIQDKPCTSMALSPVPKRKPGRPPKLCNFCVRACERPFKKNLDSANLENATTQIFEFPKERVSGPSKIALQIQDKRTFSTSEGEQQVKDAENETEKIEIDVPSPEPSMVALYLDEMHRNADEDAACTKLTSPESQSDQVKVASFSDSERNAELILRHSKRQKTDKTSTTKISDTEMSDEIETAEDRNDDDWFGNEDPIIPDYSQSDQDSDEEPEWRPGTKTKKRRKKLFKRKKGLKKRMEESTSSSFLLEKLDGATRYSRRLINAKTTTTNTVDITNKEQFFDGFTLRCSKCPFTSKIFCSFSAHLKQQHGIDIKGDKAENFCCGTCNKKFDNELNLFLHLQHAHEKTETLQPECIFCVYCFQSFGCVQLSQLHKKNVHWLRSQNFHCEVEGCLEHFISQQELEAHYKSSHVELDLFSCDKCHWPFFSEHRLRLHQFNHNEFHAEGSYECPVCQRENHSTFELARHFGQCHHGCGQIKGSKDTIRCWECPVSEHCSFLFFSKDELTAHKELHYNLENHCKIYFEGSEKGKASCAYCEENFSNRKVRESHESTCPAGPAPDKRTVKKGLFRCAKCDYSTNIRQHLQGHQSALHMGKRFQCSECSKTFSFLRNLKTHFRAKHSNGTPEAPKNALTLKCSECGSEFQELFPLNQHLRTVHFFEVANAESKSCSICNEKVEDELSLLHHLEQSHEDFGKRNFSFVYSPVSFSTTQMSQLHRKNVHWLHPQALHCEVQGCREKYCAPRELNEHYEQKHSDCQLFSCEKCHWPFLSDSLLRLHQFSHRVTPESTSESTYPCDECHHKFSSTMHLAAHFNGTELPEHGSSNHENTKSWDCAAVVNGKQCKFIFFSENELKSHKEAHVLFERQMLGAPVDESQSKESRDRSNFPCPYCPQDFPLQALRNEHVNACPRGPCDARKRETSARFACGLCSYATDQQRQMQRHSMIHLGLKIECPHCKKEFPRKENLKLHIIRKHGSEKDMLVCHICGAKRPGQNEMNYHLSEHQKKHLCSECGKAFSRGWLLSVHMRKHTGERLIACDWCSNKFKTLTELSSHMESKHPEEFKTIYGGNMRRKLKYKLVDKTIGKRNEDQEECPLVRTEHPAEEEEKNPNQECQAGKSS